MTIVDSQTVVGVDVAKKDIATYRRDLDEHSTVINEAPSLKRWLKTLPAHCAGDHGRDFIQQARQHVAVHHRVRQIRKTGNRPSTARYTNIFTLSRAPASAGLVSTMFWTITVSMAMP
jgi:hypothetical protein